VQNYATRVRVFVCKERTYVRERDKSILARFLEIDYISRRRGGRPARKFAKRALSVRMPLNGSERHYL
jgi:hypothetical protein